MKAMGLVGLVCLMACAGADPGAGRGPLTLSPDPQLAQLTSDWAERWSEATGLQIEVAVGGVPVRAVDDIDVDEGETCGATTITDGVAVDIQIDVTPPARCAGWGYMLGHEIGHALAGDATHDEGGLMARKPAQGVVLEVDADYVCSRVECPLSADAR